MLRSLTSFELLPEELIDRILELVILDETPAPRNVASANLNRVTPALDLPRKGRQSRSWSFGLQHVRYQAGHPRVNATPLLLTSKRICEQTRRAVTRLYPKGVTYTLDCILVNETDLIPTWTHIPVFSRRVSTINVTIRTFSDPNYTRFNSFQVGDSGPPRFIWTFSYLIEVFLKCGPLATFIPSQKSYYSQGVDLSVGRINVQFVSGDDESDDVEAAESMEFSEWRRRQMYGREEQSGNDAPPISPRGLAQLIARYLGRSLSMSYHMAEFGGIFYEKVGNFSILERAETIYDPDLTNSLASMFLEADNGSSWYTTQTFGHLPQWCRLMTFWNWKFYALTQRTVHEFVPPTVKVKWPSQDQYTAWKVNAGIAKSKVENGSNYKYECAENCRCEDSGLLIMLQNS